MRTYSKLAFFALLALLWGCSGKSQENRCEGVTCERGVCDGASGACANSEVCANADQCLDGWMCFDGTCFAQTPCADDLPCARGICLDGACINDAPCTADNDCVAGYACEGSECVEDACGGVDCDRGVCNPTSQLCVNSDVCTAATQSDDCLDGYFCYGQACELAENICDELECSRGVCDAATGSCVEPETCAEDTDCLDGNYCGDDDTCLANACDEQMIECARGVCDAATARCINADRCATFDACVDGFSCVDGTCVTAGEECGVGCPGAQLCVYDADATTGFCEEPERCYSALDCIDARVCVDEQCGVPRPCAADSLEPNDTSANAVRIADYPGNVVAGTICGADVDVFAFHSDDSALFRGVLLVDIAITPNDVGAGSLNLSVEHPDGTLEMVTTDARGFARIKIDVGVLNLGAYEIRVSSDTVGPGGLGYELFADMLDDPTIDACAAATALAPGSTTMGNTSSGPGYLLSSACGDPDNLAGENVYTFTAAAPSWVSLELTAPTADLTLSLQRRCEANTAVECSNSTTNGGSEVVGVAVGPGDYYVLVEGASVSSGGEYELTFNLEPLVCLRSDASCVDEDTARFCNPQGTDFVEEPCDSGCDSGTGRCSRLPRDVCRTAPDATAGLSDTVDWETLTNDYDPGPNGCVSGTNGGTQTAGPDVAYAVELAPGDVLVASQRLGSGDRGSLYLVEDCDNLTTCIASANETIGRDEELVYFNRTGSTQNLFLIADTEADSFGYNEGNVIITVQPTICTPGELRCDGVDIAEKCQTLGTDWDADFCSLGCTNGSCNPVTNVDCGSAIDLIANGPFTGRIDEYNRSFNPGSSTCARRSTSGPEALFSVTPAAGEVARVSVTAGFDAGLWVVTDCSDLSGSCVVGADTTNQTDEVVEFVGDGTTTYYVAVDSQFNGSGVFTVSATLQQPTCTPGVVLQCSSSTTLEYCTNLGIESNYSCETTCSNASCDVPRGQNCADPIVLADGQTYTGTMDLPDTINPGVGTSGACTFPSDAHPYGSDVIFAVDLRAGDFLFAEYDMNSSFAIMYALSDCNSTDTCLARSAEGLTSTLVYEALADQRVFLVLDRTTTSVSAVSYSISVDIRQQDCAIGSPPYCSDADTISYCDNFGFTRDYDCTGPCNGGVCDAPTGDVCVDARPVQAGDVVTGDWSTGTNEIQPAGVLVGNCEFDDTAYLTGPEDIYVIDLLPGDLLRAALDTNYGSAQHYILENCFDTESCQDVNFDRADGDAFYYSQFGGPVYVVVDSISTFSSTTPYTLEFHVTSGGSCVPDSAQCAASTLTRCDNGGATGASRTCANGCATGEACAPEVAADLCATAPITTGTRVYANFAELTNDTAIASTACTGLAGNGNDLIHAVVAGPGEIIHASVKSYGRETVQIYVATNCADPDATCLTGLRGDSDYFAELFYAPQTFGTYYVVAEATSSFSDEPFLVDIEVLTPECTPGAYQCAASGQAMQVCNEFGLFETYGCDGGCVNNQCGAPRGQACFDAIPLSDGDTSTGVFDEPADINPGTGVVGTCDFGTQQGSGSDTVYSVDLKAGDILDATFTSGSSFGFLYMLSDCADTDTCIANAPDGTSGGLTYSATQDETVFLVMDRTTTGTTTLSYTLSVSVRSPDCTPGTAPVCSDSNTLQACDDLGFSQTYTCGGSSGTCTAGACDTPTADVCIDSLSLTNGLHLTGDFLGTNDSSPGVGTHGACVFSSGDAADGVDHFFDVQLTAGDWFIADYTTSTSSGIAYLLGTCGDLSSCRAVTAEGADGRLAYQAATDESLTFVMDRTTSGASAIAWDLDVLIGPPSCTSGQTQCGDATTLQWCNQYGLFEDFDCATSCTAGKCDQPSSEICADPIVLTDGTTVMDDFAGTNSIDLGAGSVGLCSFGNDSQPGTDHFYQIDLVAGQTATVNWTSTSSYALAYFTTDCHDGAACLTNTPNSLSYTATSSESVFLVVDRSLSGNSASLTYEFTLTVN